jgi:hypothetical protein
MRSALETARRSSLHVGGACHAMSRDLAVGNRRLELELGWQSCWRFHPKSNSERINKLHCSIHNSPVIWVGNMLGLKWTFSGSPSAGFQHLALKHATLIVSNYPPKGTKSFLRFCFQLYPCARSVVILDALTLALVRVLPFWDVFPGAMYSEEHISCLSVDSGMKLVRFLLFLVLFLLENVILRLWPP